MKLSKRSSLLLGNVIEYYDIAVFAALSPYLETFLSTDKENASTILWIIFAIRFLARPIGGYLLLKLAEYKGRKNALLVSSCLSGFATFAMCILPTELNSEKIAIYILLVQLLTSFSFGGEYPLVVSYIIRERKTEGEKSFLSGVIVCSSMIGGIISIIVVLCLSNMLNQYQMQNFGWRIPFLIGLTNIILAYFMRKNLPKDDISSITFYKGRKISLKHTIFNIFIVAPAAIIFYAQNFCYLKLASKISENINPVVLQLINISLLTSTILIVTAKVWKYNKNKENVYLSGNILLVLLSTPLFYFINSNYITVTLASWIGITIISAMILSHLAKKLVKENPDSDKSMSLGYNLALSIFGGITPLIVNQINKYNPIYIGIIFSLSTIPYLLLELFRLKGRK
jgi:MHS family proline/betaine transporter-like MFS transporter